VTIEAARNRVRRGASVTLQGAVSSDRAVESVAVFARAVRGGGYVRVATARVGADGRWSARIRPRAHTYYRALSKSAVSPAIAVRVSR
jgi:hypothetical protein